MVGASPKRISDKMMCNINSGERRIKRVVGGAVEGINGSILAQSAKYTPVLSRARGSLQYISFFLLIIGF
jgi:hypothetical protein